VKAAVAVGDIVRAGIAVRVATSTAPAAVDAITATRN
jgi:hypothetical protein